MPQPGQPLGDLAVVQVLRRRPSVHEQSRRPGPDGIGAGRQRGGEAVLA
jgi:hypothetical protein